MCYWGCPHLFATQATSSKAVRENKARVGVEGQFALITEVLASLPPWTLESVGNHEMQLLAFLLHRDCTSCAHVNKLETNMHKSSGLMLVIKRRFSFQHKALSLLRSTACLCYLKNEELIVITVRFTSNSFLQNKAHINSTCSLILSFAITANRGKVSHTFDS